MIALAYDRIAAAIQHGHGSRFIAVLVPTSIPLLVATDKLQSHMLGRGIIVRPARVEGHSDLVDLIEAYKKHADADAFVVYGLEALSRTERESFLRSSSFARTRLAKTATAIILVLGTETWSWLSMELPDLARWADGPFVVSDDEKPRPLHPVRLRIGRQVYSQSTVLDSHRNVDLDGPIGAWVNHCGVLVVGGPHGVGLTHLAVRVEARLAALGKKTAWTENLILVNGYPRVGGPEVVTDPEIPAFSPMSALRIEDWLDRQSADVILIERAFSGSAPLALKQRNMTGLVLASTQAALSTQQPSIAQLYVPPVQVVAIDGSMHMFGVEAMAAAIKADALQQLDVDLGNLLSDEDLRVLAFASGGLPGLLWKLVGDAERRARRFGSPIITPDLVRSVVLDLARSVVLRVREEDITRAVGSNLLDFALEARGAVLFYVINQELHTLRHPLLTLANMIEGASDSR